MHALDTQLRKEAGRWRPSSCPLNDSGTFHLESLLPDEFVQVDNWALKSILIWEQKQYTQELIGGLPDFFDCLLWNQVFHFLSIDIRVRARSQGGLEAPLDHQARYAIAYTVMLYVILNTQQWNFPMIATRMGALWNIHFWLCHWSLLFHLWEWDSNCCWDPTKMCIKVTGNNYEPPDLWIWKTTLSNSIRASR